MTRLLCSLTCCLWLLAAAPAGATVAAAGTAAGTAAAGGTAAGTAAIAGTVGDNAIDDPGASTSAATSAVTFDRIAGADRYATAAELSRRNFATGAPVAYVASGLDHPDALAAGPAGARAAGPVLLVRRTSVPAATATELQRLAPRRIVVVGGTTAVSADVERTLRAYHSGGGVSRLAGPDRYATAAAVSAATFPAGVSRVYIASGAAFPDALSGGAAAAARGAPMLLTRPGTLPAATIAELQRLRPGRIIVVGGRRAVSAGVVSRLADYTTGSVQRLAGADRYLTATAVARATWGSGSTHVFVATGADFPDALVVGPVSGARNAPLLLVPRHNVPYDVWREIRRLGASRGTVLGGTAAVPAASVRTLRRECHAGNKVPAGGQQVLARIPNAPGQIALTFDMGGRLDPALDIMNYLVSADVCATIFPTGAMSQTPTGQQVLAVIRRHPDQFEVANHTMHHCDLRNGGLGSPTTAPCRVGTPTRDFIMQELTTAATIIRAGTGQDPAPYWRPPYGSYDTRVLDAAAAAGYTKTFMWDIDTVDWRPVSEGGPTARQIADKVVNNAQSGSNVLMHLGGWNTYDAVRLMVPRLRENGFTPTSLSDMLH